MCKEMLAILIEIVKTPLFFIPFIFFALLTISKISKGNFGLYILEKIPLDLEMIFGAVNVHYVYQNCPSFYSPLYLIGVLAAHFFLIYLIIESSHRIQTNIAAMIINTILSLMYLIVGIAITVYTMRFIQSGI